MDTKWGKGVWGTGRLVLMYMGSPRGSDGKESTCSEGDLGSIPGLGWSPGRRAWKPTSVFLPGESHGQGSLVGCSPRGCNELDRTEPQNTLTYVHYYVCSRSLIKIYCRVQGTLLSAPWWPKWKGNLEKRGHTYMYNWFIWWYSRK